MLKMTIINQPLCNRGDQAAHKALIKLLQDHNIEITVLFIGSVQTVNLFAKDMYGVKYITIPPFRRKRKRIKRVMYLPSIFMKLMELIPEIRKYNNIIKKSDYVLCAPGGICMGGYKNWQHIWELANSLALKKRTGIYGRSIGPFYKKTSSGKTFKRRSIDILRKVDYLSLRDKRSQEIAKDLGVAYIPTIDTAFAYKPDCEIPEELDFLKSRRYAVFVPNQLYSWHPDFKLISQEKFDTFYISIVKSIIGKGYDVVMLPQLFGMRKTDLLYFQKLSKGFDPRKIVVVSDSYNSDIQQAIVRHSSFLAGARYHSIIFAINNNVPFLCLSYEHKMIDSLRLLDLDAYSLAIKDLLEQGNDIEKVSGLLDSILNKKASVTSEIKEASSNAERIVRRSFESFMSQLYSTSVGSKKQQHTT